MIWKIFQNKKRIFKTLNFQLAAPVDEAHLILSKQKHIVKEAQGASSRARFSIAPGY